MRTSGKVAGTYRHSFGGKDGFPLFHDRALALGSLPKVTVEMVEGRSKGGSSNYALGNLEPRCQKINNGS